MYGIVIKKFQLGSVLRWLPVPWDWPHLHATEAPSRADNLLEVGKIVVCMCIYNG